MGRGASTILQLRQCAGRARTTGSSHAAKAAATSAGLSLAEAIGAPICVVYPPVAIADGVDRQQHRIGQPGKFHGAGRDTGLCLLERVARRVGWPASRA